MTSMTSTTTPTNTASRMDTTASVASELESLKTDLAQLTSDVRNVGAAMVDKGRAVAASGYGEASERLESSIHSCSRAVEERPLTSVIVALGAGLVIGKLFLNGRG